jgi:CheY-like chemotaxis protein
MNGVIGMLELMRSDARVSELRPELDLAYFSARSLLEILNDVLDFSKIEAGKLEVELLPVFFPSLVEEVVRLHAPVIRSRGLAFSSRIEPAVERTMLLDPLRLRQVFNNLIANAIKFTPQGAIELRATLAGPAAGAEPMLRVEVKDTGIGITADKRELIFSAFTQADQSTSRRYGGSGLGLTICQRLIGLMGGRIGVESLAGAGSIFWFELPARFVDVEPVPIGAHFGRDLPAETASPVVVSVAATREEGACADLLVVEDNEVNQLVVFGMLKRLGYSYELAADGVQALDRLARSRYRGVLMDVHLPLLDGLEVTRRFRMLEDEAAHLPIIALTANAHSSDRDECLGAGMDDFLDKPIQIKDLEAKLAHWLGQKGHTPS